MTAAVAVPAALCALALLDAAFAGFRASVGRDARLVDHRFNVGAAAWGLAVGAGGLALIAAATLPWLAGSTSRADRYADLVAAGGRMLTVYVPMALLNLAAIVVYLAVTNHELRAVAMTLVLGPFTLLRPVVIAGGAAWAAAGGTVPTAMGATVAAAVTIATGPAVGWLRFGRRPTVQR